MNKNQGTKIIKKRFENDTDPNEKIDSFMKSLMCNYDIENDYVKNIMHKLLLMYNRDNIEIIGNTIIARDKYFTRTISIDTKNKALTCEEKGVKKDGYLTKKFATTLIYQIDNNTELVFSNQTETTSISLKDGNTTTEKRNNSLHEYYEDNRKIGSFVDKKQSRCLTDYNGEIIRSKSSDYKRTEYYLSMGDFVRKVDYNGDIKHYYCMKSDANDQVISKIIKEKDFNRIASYKNDYNKTIGDPVVSRIRSIV